MSDLPDRLEGADGEHGRVIGLPELLHEAAERLRENETALAEQENCSRGWQALYTEAVERLRENEKDAEKIIDYLIEIAPRVYVDKALIAARRIAGKDKG